MLAGTNIHKAFEDTPVLEGVDVSIKPGTITCLVGPSGAGKTTLLRALAFLDLPDRGELIIKEHHYTFPLSYPASDITPPWPDVTVVFQSLFLWPHLTLRENILLPARNRHKPDEIDDALTELIDHFDMAHFIDNYPNQTSLGQRQRVALARAVMVKPRIILMDEITSSLDVEQVYKILTTLESLRGQGIGMMVITHLLNFARRTADQILFISDGKIVESGTPQILDKPATNRLQQFVSVVEAAS